MYAYEVTKGLDAMGALFSAFMPVVVDANVLTNKLIEVGVEASLAASIGNALSDRNLGLLEQLVHSVNVASQAEVKEVLRNTMENMVNGNKLFESVSMLTDGSGTSLSAVGSMGTLVFAAIVNRDVPFSLIFFVVVFMFGVVLVVGHVRSYMNRLRDAIQGMKKPRTSAQARIDVSSLDKDFCIDMLQRGRATEEVSVAVVDKVVSMQALSVLSGMSEFCGTVVAAVQGKLDGGASFAGMATNRDAAQARVKKEVACMKESTDAIRQCTNSAVDAIVKISEHVDTWLDEVQALDRSLDRQAAKLPRRPDCFLTDAESNRKTKILGDIKKDATELSESFTKGLNEIECPRDCDVQMLRENCDNMVRALAFSPAMAESEERAVKAAIENRSKLSAELANVAQERAVHEVKKRDIEEQMALEKTSFDTKLVHLESSMQAQMVALKKLGRGTVTMKGHPPASDKNAIKFYSAWMAGRWKDCTPYCSGSFSIVVDSDLTPLQRDGKANLEHIVDQIDDLKRKHQEKLTGLGGELSKLQAVTSIKHDREREAKEAVERAKGNFEQTLADFSMSNPVEYSQIMLLYQINECILKVAEWSFKINPGLAHIKLLSKELARVDDFHPEDLKGIVQALKDFLDTPRDSLVAFLRNVGSFELRRALKPRVSGLADVKKNLGKCITVMDKRFTEGD